MTHMTTHTTSSIARAPSRRARLARDAIRRVALVAALGVALGLLMQLAIIVLRLGAAGVAPGLTTFADLAQSVTWSVLVCTGVAVGMAVGKARTALAGMIAALFAPLSMAAAKSMQKVMLSLIEAAEQKGVLSLTTIGVVRAVEYGLLAWLLAWLSERKERRLIPYALAGGSVALVFGGLVLGLSFLAQGAIGAEHDWLLLGSMAVGELTAPIGCALVIYVAQLVATNARLWGRGMGLVG